MGDRCMAAILQPRKCCLELSRTSEWRMGQLPKPNDNNRELLLLLPEEREAIQNVLASPCGYMPLPQAPSRPQVLSTKVLSLSTSLDSPHSPLQIETAAGAYTQNVIHNPPHGPSQRVSHTLHYIPRPPRPAHEHSNPRIFNPFRTIQEQSSPTVIPTESFLCRHSYATPTVGFEKASSLNPATLRKKGALVALLPPRPPCPT